MLTSTTPPPFCRHPIEKYLKLTHLAFCPRWILLRLATGCDEIMSFHWKLSSFPYRKSYRLNFQWKMRSFLSRNQISYPLNFQWKLLSIFSRISNIIRSSFSFFMKITIRSLSQIKYLTLFHKWMEIWWCMICRSIENVDRLIVEHSLRVADNCPVDQVPSRHR